MDEHPFSQYEGKSPHRCRCFGELDGLEGTWRACPDDLCEADVLLRDKAELEIDRNDWKRISDEAEARAEAATEMCRRITEQVDELAKQRIESNAEIKRLREELERAKQEIAYTHDRGDHLVYRHEWEEFDRWQRWADDRRKEAGYQPTAQEFNDAMEGP